MQHQDTQRGFPSLATMGGHVQAGVAAIDREGLFIDINEAYTRLLGTKACPTTLRGQHFTTLTPERLRAPMQRLHDALFATGRDEPSYWQLPRQGGRDVFVRCQSVLCRCEQGTPYRVVTMVDVTEHRQHQRVLEQEQADVLAAVSRLRLTQRDALLSRRISSLDDLLRGVAHELNTPIGVCLTATTNLERRVGDLMQALEAGTLTREDLAAFLRCTGETLALLRGSTERAGAVVEGFRQVSASGAAQEDAARVHLRPYVLAALQALAPLTAGRRVAVTVKIPDDLTITTVPGALNRVLSALLSNALIHGLPSDLADRRRAAGRDAVDGCRLSISATETVNEAGGVVTLTVRDNGVGIPAADLPRVFDPFFRGGEGGSSHRGLGLYMAFNLVTGVLGGTITAESVVGHHTAFRVRLPVAPHSRPPATPARRLH